MLCCHIGYDISVEVRKYDYLDPLIELRIKHLCAHCIDKTLLNLDLRILLTDFADTLDEVSISQLYNVCLGNDRHVLLAVLSCEIKGCTGDSLSFLLGLYLEINCEVIIYLNTLVAPDVLALDILAEEGPVDVLLRNPDRTNSSRLRRRRLFALNRFGHRSPALGVTIGPLRITSHFLTSARTSSGRL